MKFENNPKRCNLCCKAFSQSVKPIPVIAGSGVSGYVCPACYDVLFKKRKLQEAR